MNQIDEHHPTGAPRDASSLQDKLRRVFAKAKLPSNPAIAAQILELVNDPNSSAEHFAQAIQADVALAARLLEMANAARFAQRTPATTIQRAVTILGLRRIRMVALGFQLVSHLDRLGECPFDLKRFWQQSVLRACLGRQIAATVAPNNVEEAFLIGLLQDCGVLPLVQLYGAEYGELYMHGDLSPAAFYQAERERFPHSHVDAIGVMATEWKLPAIIGEPLSQHHTPIELKRGAPESYRLCALSYFLGSMRLHGNQSNSRAGPTLRHYAHRNLGLDEQGLVDCFAKAAKSYRDIAPLLRDKLPDELDVTDILEEANRLLSDVASETDLHLEAAEAEREQILRQQVHLKHALGQYREQAARDPLTGLLNRAALLDEATKYIKEGASNRVPLAVFFLDLDNFKQLNDEYGHERGDEVLRRVADAIGGTLPNGALTGRYGGEEFVVVLPASSHDEALQRAKQVANAVRGIDYVRLRLPMPITCSLGAVWARPAAEVVPQQLIAAADELMYQAKGSGKDRCCFKSLEPDDTSDVLTIGPEADDPVAGRIGVGRSADGAAAFDEDLVRQIAQQLNDVPSDRVASARKQERRDLLAPCMIISFVAGENRLRHDHGYLRNISTGGIGVLVSQPLDRGEPIEVAISKSAGDTPSLFVGGLVAFCRHIKQGIYDVGIQTVVQSKDPIFRANVPPAELGLDWVTKAMVDTDEPDDLKESA
ncbi:MAG: HDOD domain-containing protein [Phycisphaerales bacterium]